MARPPEQRRPIFRMIMLALVIGVVVLALVAALVWRPLASSLHLNPAPAFALAADVKPVSAGAARAP